MCLIVYYSHQVKFTVWLTRYELFVGQPPFYTNSVYALIRHIVKVTTYHAYLVIYSIIFICDLLLFSKLIYILSLMQQDPVKYPDNMSAHFKSFLKGLLNKVIDVIFPQITSNEFIHSSYFLMLCDCMME